MICSTTKPIFSDSSREDLRSRWDWEARRNETPQSWTEFLLEKGLPRDATFNDCLNIIKIVRIGNLLDARRPRLQDLINICKKKASVNPYLLQEVLTIQNEIREEAGRLSLNYYTNVSRRYGTRFRRKKNHSAQINQDKKES